MKSKIGPLPTSP